MEKLKNNVADLISAATGLLTLIFFFLPYVSDKSGNVTSSGFNVMGMIGGNLTVALKSFEISKIGIVAAAFQIIVFLSACVLLTVGFCRILKAYHILPSLSDTTLKITLYALAANLAGNLMTALFVIMLLNRDSIIGLETSFGLYINLVLSIVAFVGFIFMFKLPDEKQL